MLLFFFTACSDYKLNTEQPVDGAAPDIAVEPAAVDFGTTGTGCDLGQTIRVSNVGAATLTVTGVTYGGATTMSGESPSFSLEPDESTTFQIRYLPTAAGRSEATLQIASNDPDEDPFAVPLVGSAVLSSTTDRFVQRQPEVDVLWVIDNSGSMSEEQQRVIADIESFFTYFTTLNLDYHMGVVTTDIVTPTMIGRLQGSPSYITPETPDALSVLSAALQVGTEDQGDESGLAGMRDALSEPMLSAENAGFYRPEAQLVIAVLSDEPEQSGYASSEYIDFLMGLKADPTWIKFSAIVGDYDAGCATTCDGADSTAQPGNAYVDVANAFPGVFGSICTCSLGPILDSIGLDATLFTRAFPLSATPADPLAIAVDVDGVTTTDWTYDSASNSVIFNVPPEADQLVDITYDLVPICE